MLMRGLMSGTRAPILYDFAGNSYPTVSVSRASSGYVEDLSGNLSLVSANVLRRSNRGALIEPVATNLIPQSNGFATSPWSTTELTVTSVAGTAPDGGGTVFQISDSANANVHQLFQAPTGSFASTATSYANSIYAKAGTGRYLTLSNLDSSIGNGGYAVFDLAAGTITQSGSLGSGTFNGASIVALANGFYRLRVAATGSTTQRFYILSASNTATYSPDGAGRKGYTGANNTYLIWGAQFELNPVSSYIPTTTAAATRAADSAQITIPAGYTQGVFTLDDNSTQTVTGLSAGAYGLPTSFAPKYVRSLELRPGP